MRRVSLVAVNHHQGFTWNSSQGKPLFRNNRPWRQSVGHVLWPTSSSILARRTYRTASSSSHVTLPPTGHSALCNYFEKNGSSFNRTELWLGSSSSSSSSPHKIHRRARGEGLTLQLSELFGILMTSPTRQDSTASTATFKLTLPHLHALPSWCGCSQEDTLIICTQSRSHTCHPIKTTKSRRHGQLCGI